jgi:hypothetical protein
MWMMGFNWGLGVRNDESSDRERFIVSHSFIMSRAVAEGNSASVVEVKWSRGGDASGGPGARLLTIRCNGYKGTEILPKAA